MIESEEGALNFVAKLCDQAALTRLQTLATMLAEENTRQNLVSAGSLACVWQRHIADSAQLLGHVSRGTNALLEKDDGLWLDLGTGAGFPGLVIAAMRPDWHIVLVELRKRRIEWLNQAVSVLSLPLCQIKGQKVEELGELNASAISARAFAPLAKLVPLARRFSTRDTMWLLPKGRSAAQEVNELPQHLQAMFHVERSATDADLGIVVGQIMDQSR